MSEPRIEGVLRELRATAPAAPEALRNRVRGLPEPAAGRRLQLRLRPALAAAAAIAIAVGVGAAVIGGATRQSHRKAQPLAAVLSMPAARPNRGTPAVRAAEKLGKAQHGAASSGHWPAYSDQTASSRSLAPLPLFSPDLAPLSPSARLQDYRASFRLRVKDLSAATKSAIRTTRRLDGYVAAANYSTAGRAGDSVLDLRVPIQRVQQAIASFTDLGTIVSQQIGVADLQAQVDRLDRRIAADRRLVARLELKQRHTGLSLDEQAQLRAAKQALARLSHGRANVVREATYAKISLSLTTQKPAAQQTQPGRFDRFWGDASDILGKEAIVVLYALVVSGPFLLLAALALLGERVRRRRANSRLLEETG